MEQLRDSFFAVRGMHVLIGAIFIVASLFRLLPLLVSGTIGGFRGYDDGVHYAAGVNLLSGNFPYSDFVLVHPPGIAILMVPFAALGWLVSDTVGICAARGMFAVIGALNAVFIGMLLKKWGYLAVVAGAGAYSVSSVATVAERSIMLSPLLTFCTLLALLALRSTEDVKPGQAVTLAAAVLGFALCVKLWAIIPILVLMTMVTFRHGPRMFLRFAAVGIVTCAVVIGPFLLNAPRVMFNDVVLAQLARTDGAVKGLGFRLKDFAGLPLPQGVLIAVALIGVVAIAVSAVIGLSVGMSPKHWGDEFWWGVLATVTTTALLVSMSFFDHYPNFAAPYLALCLGASLGLMIRVLATRRPRNLHLIALGGVVAVLVPIGIDGYALEPKPLPAVNEQRLAAEVAAYDCVFTAYSYLGIASDSISRSVRHDCGSTVDIYGTRMVESLDNPISRGLREGQDSSARVQFRQLQVAQAVVVGKHLAYYGMSELAISELTSNFVIKSTQGNYQVWERR